jgi:hypothetical protein
MRDIDSRVVTYFNAPTPVAFRSCNCVPRRRVTQLRQTRDLLITLSAVVVAGAIFLLIKLVNQALTTLILTCTLLAAQLLPLLLVLLGNQTNI